MATIPTKISPSPNARRLFSAMVARSTERCHLTLKATLQLAMDRKRDGVESDHAEIDQLQKEGWISQAPDGGWLLK